MVEMADEKQSEKKAAIKQVAAAESIIQMALALPLGCAVGWLGGSWLDQKLHQGWIGVVGILLGAVGGFTQILRLAGRSAKRD